jgi:arsenite oxidase small subunit
MTTDATPTNSEPPTPPVRVTRRGFGKFIGAGIGAAVVGSLWVLREWYHSQATPVRLIAHADEIPVRGSKIFQYPTDVAPCILVRAGEADYVAYSRICTHNSCPVFYHPEENAFFCPCHNGLFSVANGAVLQGPPPRPLPRILLRIRGNDIFAVGIANS